MPKIKKVFENVEFPTESGWYWVLLKGYDSPTPCWYMHSNDYDDRCFLPGGMGDSSSMGVYSDDIDRVGPEIQVPNF